MSVLKYYSILAKFQLPGLTQVLLLFCTSPHSHYSLQVEVPIIVMHCQEDCRKSGFTFHIVQKLVRQVDTKAFLKISDT